MTRRTGNSSTTNSVPHMLPIGRVREMIGGKSRSTIYRWIDQGIFPPPIKIGPNSVAWTYDSIIEWLNSKLQGAQ